MGRAAVAALMVLTAIVAILGGMVIGSGLSNGVQSPTSNRADGNAGGVTIPTLPDNGGTGGAPTTDPFGGNGSSASGNANQGNQNNGISSSLSTAAARVLPGTVNITTRLGYEQAVAAGTGMVISSTGQVLTNNHVIDGATSIQAMVVGTGKTYTAKVIGTAPSEDVAVIQLEGASGLKTVPIGDSSAVKVGDPIVAMGNAGGKGGTPTQASGNVVALHQQITAGDESGSKSEQLEDLIQVDAAIQPGDSGGPLINVAGQVIGMNTAASVSRWTGSSPQGFAIPITAAGDLAKQIIAGKASDVVHIGLPGILGVEVSNGGQSSDPFGIGGGSSSSSGATVAGVASGSPAEKAGIAVGDTITAVDGTSVSSADDLTKFMSGKKPGTKVTVTWVDATGTMHKAAVALTEGPAD
jgi:S1-C subfamily serine protease